VKKIVTKQIKIEFMKTKILLLIALSTISISTFSQDMRLPGSGGSSSSSSDGGGRAIDFNQEAKLKQDMKDMALSVANRLMKCCSKWGGTNVWGTVEYDNVRVNDITKTFIVPMTVGWRGSISGNEYYIKGQLVIDKEGNKMWNKIEDSGGFPPGCSTGCIN
jgi:hypothetical protein